MVKFSSLFVEEVSLCGVFVFLLAVHVEAQCSGGAEEMKVLYKTLLSDYNPVIRPSRNYSTPTNVTTQLDISFVMGLDTKHQLLYLRAFIRLMWIDEYLQWDPKDYGCISRMLVPQNTIWKPDVILFSAANEHDKLGREAMFISVNSNGVAKWEPPFYLEGTCKLDMTKYPFDVNVCHVVIASWMTDNQSTNFVWSGTPVNTGAMVINGEYEITSGGASKEALDYEGQFFEMLTFTIVMTRRPLYIVVSLLLPVNLLAVLGILSFIMPPEEPEKVAISITTLLSFTVFLSFIDNTIPPNSDKLSLLVIYIAALLVLSFLSVVGNVLVVTVKSSGQRGVEILHASEAETDLKQHSASTMPFTITPQERPMANHDFLRTQNQEFFSFEPSQTKNETKDKNHISHTRATTLNKIFLIISCVLFFFISCLMLTLVTVQ